MSTARAGGRGATGSACARAVCGAPRGPRQRSVALWVAALLLAPALLTGSRVEAVGSNAGRVKADVTQARPGSDAPARPQVLPGPRETAAPDPGWNTFRTFG